MKKKFLAAVLAVVMMVPLFSTLSMAKSSSKTKAAKYKVVTALGDSASSGFGLPDYQKYGKLVLVGKRIKNSYPDLVAKKVGAKTLHSYGVSGIRTEELRYLLDPSFPADQILKGGDMGMFSEGVITEKNLKKLRPRYIKAVKEADLITLDIGFDDIWVPTIACIYDIAKDGRYDGTDANKTVQELVKKYGSERVVMQNIMAYLIGFASNPQKWAYYWVHWDIAVLKWATDFNRNYDAIVKKIYQLNPDVTIVALGCYNPCKDWSILPHDQSIEHSIQWYYDLINSEKSKFESLYPNYHYVSTRNVELINNKSTLPLYENVTLDASGFNPHPTAKGHRTIANRILKELGY